MLVIGHVLIVSHIYSMCSQLESLIHTSHSWPILTRIVHCLRIQPCAKHCEFKSHSWCS